MIDWLIYKLKGFSLLVLSAIKACICFLLHIHSAFTRKGCNRLPTFGAYANAPYYLESDYRYMQMNLRVILRGSSLSNIALWIFFDAPNLSGYIQCRRLWDVFVWIKLLLVYLLSDRDILHTQKFLCNQNIWKSVCVWEKITNGCERKEKHSQIFLFISRDYSQRYVS